MCESLSHTCFLRLFLDYFIAYGNELDGMIPSEFGRLQRLSFLVLSNNLLTGSLPSQLGLLLNLRGLELDDNRLTNIIPPEIQGISILGEF